MLHAAPQPWMGPRLIGMHFLHMHHWTRAAMRCPSRGTLCLGELSCFTVYHHTQRGPGSFLTWPGEHQASRQPPTGKSGSCWLCSGHVWPSLPQLLHWLVPGNFVPDFVRWEAAAQQQSWSYWVILMIWWHKFKLMRFWTEHYAGFCWNSYIFGEWEVYRIIFAFLILSIHLSLWCLILFRFYQNHHMGFVIHISSFKTLAPGWGFMTDSTMTSVPTSSEESTTEPE